MVLLVRGAIQSIFGEGRNHVMSPSRCRSSCSEMSIDKILGSTNPKPFEALSTLCSRASPPPVNTHIAQHVVCIITDRVRDPRVQRWLRIHR